MFPENASDSACAGMSLAAFALATVCVSTFWARSRSPFSYIDSASPNCAWRRSEGSLMYSGSIFTPSSRNSGTRAAGFPGFFGVRYLKELVHEGLLVRPPLAFAQRLPLQPFPIHKARQQGCC